MFQFTIISTTVATAVANLCNWEIHRNPLKTLNEAKFKE